MLSLQGGMVKIERWRALIPVISGLLDCGVSHRAQRTEKPSVHPLLVPPLDLLWPSFVFFPPFRTKCVPGIGCWSDGSADLFNPDSKTTYHNGSVSNFSLMLYATHPEVRLHIPSDEFWLFFSGKVTLRTGSKLVAMVASCRLIGPSRWPDCHDLKRYYLWCVILYWFEGGTPHRLMT